MSSTTATQLARPTPANRLDLLSLFRAFVIHPQETKVGHEFEALSGQIIEAALHVHKSLGPGFLQTIYENALCVALRSRGIPYEAQREVRVLFEGSVVGVHRLDLVVGDEIIVELKAVKALEDIHLAQLRSYLKAIALHVGLLMNFNAPTLVVKRVVLRGGITKSREYE